MRYLVIIWESARRACLLAAPAVADSNRVVRPVVTGIGAPAAMAFLTAGDFLLIEKNSGGQA